MTIQFTPHLIPVNRGILTTLYLAPTQHFSSGPGVPPANSSKATTTLAALATATSRIRLGLLVTGMTYRHLSVYAAQALTIDHASHGRLEMSFGNLVRRLATPRTRAEAA